MSKKIKFNKELTAILTSLIVISAVFFGITASKLNIFDHADNAMAADTNAMAAGTNAVPQSVSRDDKETISRVEKLKSEGFSQKDISEAESLAQYIESKLTSICQIGNVSRVNIPKPEAAYPLAENNSKDEDLTAYKALLDKFDVNTSIELMTRMKKDLGSIGNVMDEYLFSLQAEIDLMDYIGKVAEYQKIKKEKSTSLTAADIITSQKIEEKLLAMLQKQNPSVDEQTSISGKLPQAGNGGSAIGKQNPVVPVPNVPKPGISNRQKADTGVNMPDSALPKAGRPIIPKPVVPGKGKMAPQPNNNLW